MARFGSELEVELVPTEKPSKYGDWRKQKDKNYTQYQRADESAQELTETHP